MKYIRTKDGIYDTSNMKWCECSKQASHYKDKNYMLYVPIKTADTIEELCDEFIGVNKNNEHDRLSKLSLKSYCNYVAIYSAIWTEWGLKYIAKINSKGELELLWDTL